MKNKNIVVFGLQSWDISIGFNCKNIALELSKNNRVLFVNRPITRSSSFFKKDPFYKNRLQKIKVSAEPLEKINDNLHVLTPPIITESIQRVPFTFFFNYFNRLNNQKFANQIKKYIDHLGFDEFILFNDNDMFNGQYLKELLKPTLSVYYIRDYLICQDYFKRNGIRAERTLIEKSDLVVANSVFLKEYAEQYNSNSHFIGQGCDLSIFQRSINKNAEKQPKKVIGYTGVLSSMRLDHELLLNLCEKMPEYHFSFVGPMDKCFAASPLHNYENVTFHGLHPKEDMPKYIKIHKKYMWTSELASAESHFARMLMPIDPSRTRRGFHCIPTNHLCVIT